MEIIKIFGGQIRMRIRIFMWIQKMRPSPFDSCRHDKSNKNKRIFHYHSASVYWLGSKPVNKCRPIAFRPSFTSCVAWIALAGAVYAWTAPPGRCWTSSSGQRTTPPPCAIASRGCPPKWSPTASHSQASPYFSKHIAPPMHGPRCSCAPP